MTSLARAALELDLFFHKGNIGEELEEQMEKPCVARSGRRSWQKQITTGPSNTGVEFD
jgi:hypothetical protein